MNINSVLKKEGIKVLEQLSTFQVNSIASSISNKLCNTFPEHNLDKQLIFANLARLNMFIAEIPENDSKAKYFSLNNSIYFSSSVPFEEIGNIAVHECIHYLQEIKDKYGNLIRLGLSSYEKGVKDLNLNEAAVQLMASETNNNKPDTVTYYNITLSTISPSYYPLQCCIVNQMAYFTGTYPLYNSTLFSNDIFKNTFIAKTSKKTYNTISENLDKIANLEYLLYLLTVDMQNAKNNVKTINSINKLMSVKKKAITKIFIVTQNLILEKCFNTEFNNIRNKKELHQFQERLYNYKNLLGITPDYEFFNTFYYNMMIKLEKKEEYIENNGDILIGESKEISLMLYEEKTGILYFIKKFFKKLRKLSGIKQESGQEYK